MFKINKKLTKKGFSLIELMVAVAILALAIFGILNSRYELCPRSNGRYKK